MTVFPNSSELSIWSFWTESIRSDSIEILAFRESISLDRISIRSNSRVWLARFCGGGSVFWLVEMFENSKYWKMQNPIKPNKSLNIMSHSLLIVIWWATYMKITEWMILSFHTEWIDRATSSSISARTFFSSAARYSVFAPYNAYSESFGLLKSIK